MKTFTKHILLLALMLFGVAGAAWASRAPQKFTGPVDIDNLVQGDTLAQGFELVCNGDSRIIISAGNAKVDGNPYESNIVFDCTLINAFSYGPNGAIISGPNTATPAYGDWQDGNAWVVTDAYFDEYQGRYRVTLGGISINLAPDPYAPALDETTGNWNFLMPGSNKVVNVQLLDSIVVGPHVSVEGLAIEGKYANGTDTVYYYDTNSHSSITLRAAANDGQGRNFGYWADLDPTDPEYSSWYRYISSGRFTCGDTFRAVYPDNHTLSLVTPQGGGTLEIAGVTYDTVYNISFDHMGTPDGYRTFTIPASRLPYDTTFNYSDHIDEAVVSEPSGKLSINNQSDNTVTIRISGAFEGTGSYTCLLGFGEITDDWLITCEASTVPVYPYGISKTGNGTYSVMEGLTVNVTATPDSAHYLARIDGLDTVSNAACGYTFTMPGNDYPLMADFNAKPTLTLDQTDGGTLEAIIPSGAPTTAQLNVPSEWMTDNTYVTASHLPGFVAMTDEEAQAIACPDAEGRVRVIHKLEGVGYLRVIQFSNGVKQGQSSTIARDLDNIYNECNSTFVIKYYYTTGTTAPNVIASSTPNTYYIDYGTPVTVKATPDSVHYLVSFSDDDNDTNSNIAVEKTYDSVVNNINLQANFQAKPVLTLTANDGGTMTLDGMTNDTVYTIAFDHGGTDEGDRTFTIPASLMPYDTTFSYDDNVGTVGVNEPSGKLSIINRGDRTVTIRISGECTGIYSCDYGPGIFDQWLISCEASTQPKMPYGITKTGDNTFVVDYGTEVTVVANPDSVHYLATLGGVTMGSNTAKDTTFAVTATTNLEANFAQKPTLTLAHNDGGEMEIVPAGGVTFEQLTTDMIPTWYMDFTDPITEADLQAFGFVPTDEATANTWTGALAQGDSYLVYGFENGQVHYIRYINGTNNGSSTEWFYKGSIYNWAEEGVFAFTGAATSNVTASTEPNTYYIDYNTSVTVKATPSDTAYLVRFDQDADTNSNVAVEKTYGPLTAALTTAEATFNDKPVLTLAQNESWGSVTIEGAGSAAGEVQIGEGTGTTNYFPIDNTSNYSCTEQIYTADEIGAAGTINSISFYNNNGTPYTASNATMYLKHVSRSAFSANTDCEPISAADVVWTGNIAPTGAGWYTFTLDTPFEYNGTDNLMVAFFDGTDGYAGTSYTWRRTQTPNYAIMALRYYSDTDIPDPYNLSGYTGNMVRYTYRCNIKLGFATAVAQIDSVTYRVDYGTTVTVKADATELHHVANWVNEDSVDYPETAITYGRYFVTEPEPLFPDSSTLTITVTADATAKALFGINSYDVVATAQLDDRAEIGTDTSMGYIAVSYIDIVGDAQTVAATDTAEYTAQGGSTSTLTVTPHYGYLFTGWSVTQNNQTTQSTQNPLTLTEAATVVARFVPDTFEVSTFTATPADTLASAGTVTGADRYAYRTLVTLEETPATGYHFDHWSNTARTALGTETTVTVQLMQDTAIFAVMDTNVYDITYTIQTDDRDEIGTGLEMGSVVLEGRHMHFLNDVLTVTPAYGYVFEGWYSNDELASTDNPFTFSPVADIEYEARFVPDTFTVSLTMNDEHAGDVLPHGQLPAGVTVGPNVTYRVPYLVPMTFYGAAMEHNHIVNWINENDAEYVDGVTYSDYLVCDTFPTTSLLTLAVTGDTTVKINFLVDYYYVTVGLDEESTGRGTVTGSGYYDHGDTVTAMASPAEGYHFDGWDNGVEISPYAFAAVQDSTILVHFDTNVYSLTVVAETDTNTGLPMGTTLGDGLVKHFLYYDIEAVAEEGYHFVMWTDSVTDNPRTVTLTENTTFTAHFEMDPIVDVVINGVSTDETMGTVSGSDTVDYGEEVILTATANEHYHFVQWNDGNSDNPRTVVAAHDSTLTAYFAVNQYAVVGVSADETMGTVSGSDTADYQSVVVLTATAGDCYHFESWSDGETANPRSIVAEADTTVSALFAANVYSMNDTVTVCDSYEWNGTVYTQSGTYTHDGTTAAGCDMLETLYLTVNASTTAVETVTACDSYEWHDSVYTASTDESTYQTTNAAGCDSTVTLHLTVNAATASEESETACNYYTWHGETYTVSGDYSYTTQNAAGCDSTVTLHLTVNYGNLISIDSTVCDSIVWRGNVYTESGVYDFDLPSESGCFSIETLNLTVNYSSSAVETIFACDSYTWNGLQFDADNHTATYFTVNAVGCDSTVMLDLTVHYSNEGTDNVTACDSVEWHGTVYTASDNTATYSTINAAGCDSTVVLVLTINHSVSDTVEVTAEESYEWNGEVYSQSGTYTYSGTTEAGCDSTVTLLLTITYQPQPVYYTVTLVSADTTMGSVLPAEAMSVEEGSQFSATAIALYGRHFVAWERDGQVVSTDNPYSFEVTEDVELTATFAYNPVTVILSVNNANWGSTDPAPGTYTYEVGEQATVTATPAEGFHMMGWTINGTVIETDETTYTVEATPEMAGMTFSVVAMFVRDIAIDDVEDGNIAVYASEGKIVVSGAEHRDVYVYDVTGRCVSRQADAAETVVFPVAQTGVYMVKIGNLPARKVALVR